MKLTHVAVVATLALLVGAGSVVAAPGSVPSDAGQSGAAGPSDDVGQSNDVGPPSSLPEPVPEFVTDVFGSIGDFVSGGVDHLGDAVRSVTPGGSGEVPEQG